MLKRKWRATLTGGGGGGGGGGVRELGKEVGVVDEEVDELVEVFA